MLGHPISPHQQRQDLALAAALTVFGVAEALAWPDLSRGWSSATQPIDLRSHLLLAVVSLGFTATLALRRRFPAPVLATAVAASFATGLFNHQGGALAVVVGVSIACFTVGSEMDFPSSLWGPALSTAMYWAVSGLAERSTQASDYFFPFILYVPPWIYGAALRIRGRRLRQAMEHAARLEAEQAAALSAAAAEERSRIARELHDIVSHSITVISIQAQAVRHRLRPDQTAEAGDLKLLETTARQAMAEMRRLFGVIRKEGDGPGLAPQPGLAQLPALIEQLRASGLKVAFEDSAEAGGLPPGLDLAAYRVIQEALTNVLRHAGPTAKVVVRIDHGRDQLRLLVEDDGLGGAGRVAAGHGLVGMRERVALYGGTLETGSQNGRGYMVRASIPMAVD